MTYIYTKLLTGLMLIFVAMPSYAAEEGVVDILPPITQTSEDALNPDNITDPILRLTPDKSELIRLEKEAGSVIIGNPLHMNIIADSSTTLVIVPRLPGATHFTILDKSGQIIMQRHVIVASPKENYVRVKRTCSEDSKLCQNTSIFYCPDICHEIGLNAEEASSSQKDTASSGNNSPSNQPNLEQEDGAK